MRSTLGANAHESRDGIGELLALRVEDIDQIPEHLEAIFSMHIVSWRPRLFEVPCRATFCMLDFVEAAHSRIRMGRTQRVNPSADIRFRQVFAVT